MDFLELRLSARRLLRQPGFALSVIMLMILGVGAGTAVFTLVNELLLTTPPGIHEPERVVRLNPAEDRGLGVSSYPDFAFYRDNARAFSELFAYDAAAYTVRVRAADRDEDTELRFVTGNFFNALGQRALAGRLLVPADDGETAPNALVVGQAFSERFFGGPASALGRTLRVAGFPFTVVGVVSRSFQGAARDDAPVDLWLPVWKRLLVNGRPRADMVRTPQYVHAFLTTMARLRPGVSRQAAQAEMDALAERVAQSYDEDRTGVTLTHDFGLSAARRTAVVVRSRLIAGLAALVLLMVCANLANLALARALNRRQELIVKLALGAGRLRLVRQFGVETLLLGAVGGLLSLIVAGWASRALLAFMPFQLTRPPQPDLRVYLFALTLTVLAALVCGLAPVLFATRVSVVHSASARLLGGGAAVRSFLVVAQLALGFILITGAALFTRTLDRVLDTPIGFEPERVLVVQLNAQAHGYNEQTGPLFYEQVLQRIQSLPGVQSAALGGIVPFQGGRRTSTIEIEGRPVVEDQPLTIDNNVIGPGYLRTVRLELVRGRDVQSSDHAGAPQIALINESMAQRFWPGQDPIGRRFRRGQSDWMEVVGVVRDTRAYHVTEPPVPMFYRAFAQAYFPRMQVYLHSAGEPARLTPAVRRAVAEVDPTVVVRGIDPLQQIYRRSFREVTANARLVGVLGSLALLLSALGLYAVTSYFVTQRTPEFGLRLALGAQPRDLLRDVLAGAARRAALGLTIGLAASLALVSLVERFLFALSPTDPAAFASAALLLAGCTLVASWWPAARATRVQPTIALRGEN